MNQIQTENTQEKKIEQVQNNNEAAPQVKAEESPPIRSEENKANWKAFREQRETERRAKEESDRRATEKAAEAEALRAALEALANKPSNNHQSNDSYSNDNQEADDAKIDRLVEAKLKQKEQEYEKRMHEREIQELPKRLVQTHPDFDRVCSTENLDYLEYHHPEIATPYKYMPDGFEKWNSIYKAVKKYVPNVDSKPEALKAEKNLQKPGSISSTGNTQGGNAMPGSRLDEAKKAENWARMQRVMKGLS